MRKENVLCLSSLNKIILGRQVNKKTDTFCVIYGFPGTGKTTFGFQMLIKYLKSKRQQYRNGETEWDPPLRWRKLFEKYFAGDSEDMSNKTMNNEDESFCFVDEGNDVASWKHALDKEQSDLIELLQKTRKKKMLTIFITPTMKLLDKNILSRAQYLFIVAGEPVDGKNEVFVFINHKNTIKREYEPFGFSNIIKDVLKRKTLSDEKQFERFLLRQERCVGKITYREIDPKLYKLYDVLVKDPQIMKIRKRKRMMPIAEYEKLKYSFDTLLYNLYIEGNKIPRISNLLRDKYGRQTISATTIKARIDEICAIQIQPPTINDEEQKTINDEKTKMLEMHDILGLSFEELERNIEGP